LGEEWILIILHFGRHMPSGLWRFVYNAALFSCRTVVEHMVYQPELRAALFAGEIMDRPSLAAPSGPGAGRRYHIHTFGCQMNLADSERMAGALEAAGYACSPNASEADVLIYNTCSIRDKAEQKVYSALGKQVLTLRWS
jgi:Uncharacterized protein family UPF0004